MAIGRVTETWSGNGRIDNDGLRRPEKKGSRWSGWKLVDAKQCKAALDLSLRAGAKARSGVAGFAQLPIRQFGGVPSFAATPHQLMDGRPRPLQTSDCTAAARCPLSVACRL